MADAVPPAAIAAAEAYEAVMVPALMNAWVRRVADAASIRPGERVLDLACGTGVLTREIAARVGGSGSVSGFDRNAGMLAVAERRAPALAWRQGSAEQLPFADESFDAVVCQFGLMFFEDRPKAIREVLRVLDRRGRIAFAVWDNIESIPAYFAELLLIERRGGQRAGDALRAPFVLGDREALADLVRGCGVAQVRVDTVQATARFPSVRVMLEADVRGWLPLVGVVLPEDQIAGIINEAEDVLAPYVAADGSVAFDMSAHIVSGTKPPSSS